MVTLFDTTDKNIFKYVIEVIEINFQQKMPQSTCESPFLTIESAKPDE